MIHVAAAETNQPAKPFHDASHFQTLITTQLPKISDPQLIATSKSRGGTLRQR